MTYEWPLLGTEAGRTPAIEADAVPRFYDTVELIRGSEAVDAFARRRAGQIIHSGHTPETDLDKAPGALAREALYRLTAFLEIVGPQRMNLPPMRRGDCLKYVEGAGAVLIALWERLQVEIPE